METHQKSNKKEIDKLDRQIKKIAKNNARMLVMQKFPEMKEIFEPIGADGLAESVLIGLYAIKVICY